MSRYSVKRSKWMTLVLPVLLVSLLEPAWAMLASDLLELKVIGHHFTTRASSDKSLYYAKDPQKSRILVLKIAARVPSGWGILFTNDFVLRYFRDNGKEDRSSAVRICRAETSVIGESADCLVSQSGWINIGSDNVIFTVSFYVENDVKSVDIFRVGGSSHISYDIGTERPYSVFVTTNRGVDSLAPIVAVIEKGGYRVLRTSGALDGKVEGITIYHANSAEGPAREISQRIMTLTHTAPSIKESKFANSDSDVVVWVGK